MADIIIVALTRADQPIGSVSLELAFELAKEQRVFYIEHPFSLKDVLKEIDKPHIKRRRAALFRRQETVRKLPKASEDLYVLTPPITLPINKIPPGKFYKMLSQGNNELIKNHIKHIIEAYDIQEWVYINSFDPFYGRELPEEHPPVLKMYHCWDDIAEVPYTARHGVRLEQEMMRDADVTLCSSTQLMRYCKQYNPNTYLLPNATRPERFTPVAEAPETLPPVPELESIPRPIIGFTGSLEYRTNYELIERLAREHSDKQLVFIGPLRTEEMHTRGIADLPNVHLLPPRDISELPACTRYIDVFIIPYKKNKLTRSIYPLKINEHLASGKPVIATNFSPDIESFSEVIYIAENDDAFVKLVGRAISEDEPARREKRVACARDNSWLSRANQLRKLIKSHLQNR